MTMIIGTVLFIIGCIGFNVVYTFYILFSSEDEKSSTEEQIRINSKDKEEFKLKLKLIREIEAAEKEIKELESKEAFLINEEKMKKIKFPISFHIKMWLFIIALPLSLICGLISLYIVFTTPPMFSISGCLTTISIIYIYRYLNDKKEEKSN